jgi:hypothetical protein
MWVLPSLNRPQRLVETLRAMRATGMSTPGVVILGASQARDIAAIREELPEQWSVTLRAESDRSLVHVLNRFFALDEFRSWYGMIADDDYPVTQRWDVKLIEAANRHGIATGDDGWQSPWRLGSAAVWRGDVLCAAGFWMPPCVRHWYVDDFWEFIGRGLNLWHCDMTVRVEHLHHANGRAPIDSTYQIGDSGAALDKAAFLAWIQSSEFQDVVDRLTKLSNRQSLRAA